MSTESQDTGRAAGADAEHAENPEDVAHGVTNEPRGSGDVDRDAVDAGTDRLEQAGGGH